MAGHNEPGGGFVGGMVAGLALVLRYLAGGRYELSEAAPVQAGFVLGSGMVIAVTAGVLPLLFGGTVFASATDRKSTRLNSSHVAISYAVFCLKKKKTTHYPAT